MIRAQNQKYQLGEKAKFDEKKIRPTSKFIIVGHPLSGYQDLEQTLIQLGMNPALPTLREGLSAQQVTNQICAAHGVVVQDTLYPAIMSRVKQLTVNPIWHALVLDLVRGNLSQKFWGWSDSKALFLLDFWKSVSSDFSFLLVYDHPYSALNASSENGKNGYENELDSHKRRLTSWKFYNEALLHFYYNNQDCCLLIHAAQLRNAPDNLLNEVNGIAGVPLKLVSDHGIVCADNSDSDVLGNSDELAQSVDSEQLLKDGRNENGTSSDYVRQFSPQNPLEAYLLEALLDEYIDVKQLYDELQSAATIPLLESQKRRFHIDDAWQVFQELVVEKTNLFRERTQLEEKLCKLQDAAEQRNVELRTEKKLHEQLYYQNFSLHGELNKLKEENKANANKIAELEKQKELVLHSAIEKQAQIDELSKSEQLSANQLNLVQRDLETYAVENARIHSRQQQLERNFNKIANEKELLSRQIAALEEEKQAQTDNLIQEGTLTTKQLQIVQKELEWYAVENARMCSQQQTLESEKKRQLDELDRKRQLATNQLQNVKKELELYVAEHSGTGSRQQQLERVNRRMVREVKQLSVQIATLENELAGRMQVIVALKRNQKPVFSGAAERQKRELFYRVGSLFVVLGQSLAKWRILFYPFFIRKCIRQYIKDCDTATQWLPPLDEYVDYEEAAKLHDHLSYQLGLGWRQNFQKPFAYFRVLHALFSTYRDWKNQKKMKVKQSCS